MNSGPRCLVLILSSLVVALGPSTAAAQATSGAAPVAQPANPSAALAVVAQRSEFTIFLRGAPIGKETVSVARSDGEWVIKGTGRIEPPINFTLREGEIRYGLDLTPRALKMLGQFRDAPLELTTTIDAGTATSKLLQGTEASEATAVVSPGAILLPNNFLGAYAALAARLAGTSPGGEARVFIAPQTEIPVVLDKVTTERVQTPARSFGVRQYHLTFRNPGGPLEALLEVEEDGPLVGLTIISPQLRWARTDVASVAARNQRFTRAGDEDVRIPANGFTIAGTISRPQSALKPLPKGVKPERLPAIVLVSGSGSVDRDEFVAGIPIFGQLSSMLADAGFLVVRYDKRGVGLSGGRTDAATQADYAEDVLSILKWLTDRDDVDEKRITVVGHSEGAGVALLAGARQKKIARLVSIAGIGTTGADLVLEQQQAALAKTQLSDKEKQERVEMQKRIHAALLAGATWAGVPDGLKKQADTPWFASLLAFDPSKVVPKVPQPILIVAAELDKQVPTHHAEKLAALARARKKDPGEKLVIIPGINHLLVPAKTGEPEEYASLPDRNVSPAVAAAIVDWLQGK